MREGIKERQCFCGTSGLLFFPIVTGCTTVFEDNEGAFHLASYPATTPNSKQINTRYHFFRERVAEGEFRVVYVESALQRADFLPKALPKDLFYYHRDFVMSTSLIVLCWILLG